MKSAILTFVYSWNPGTILQAYALQHAVESLDSSIKCIVLRHYHANRRIPVPPFLRKPSWKTFIRWIYTFGAQKACLRFAEKYFHFYPERPVYKKSDLCNMQYEFDKIIVGGTRYGILNFAKNVR